MCAGSAAQACACAGRVIEAASAEGSKGCVSGWAVGSGVGVGSELAWGSGQEVGVGSGSVFDPESSFLLSSELSVPELLFESSFCRSYRIVVLVQIVVLSGIIGFYLRSRIRHPIPNRRKMLPVLLR